MEPSLQIEPMTPESPSHYFAQLAEIHRTEIQGGFLSTLGPRFLQNLYREISRSQDAFLLVARRNDTVAGFICGTDNLRRVYRQYLWHRGLKDVWTVLPRLVTPKRISSAIETLMYPKGNSQDELPDAELMNFCVRTTEQRNGVGKRLFFQLVREFEQRGTLEIRIVTGGTQHKAQCFYESLGARKVAETEIHRGIPSIVFTYNTSLGIPAAMSA